MRIGFNSRCHRGKGSLERNTLAIFFTWNQLYWNHKISYKYGYYWFIHKIYVIDQYSRNLLTRDHRRLQSWMHLAARLAWSCMVLPTWVRACCALLSFEPVGGRNRRSKVCVLWCASRDIGEGPAGSWLLWRQLFLDVPRVDSHHRFTAPPAPRWSTSVLMCSDVVALWGA